MYKRYIYVYIYSRFLYLADATTPWRLGVCASRGTLPFPRSGEQRVPPLNLGKEQRRRERERVVSDRGSREKVGRVEDKLERGRWRSERGSRTGGS